MVTSPNTPRVRDGLHLTMDGVLDYPDPLLWDYKVRMLLNESIGVSGMTKIAGPFVAHGSMDAFHGWALLAESHVSCHLRRLADGRVAALFDLFSCYRFEVAKVERTVQRYLGPGIVRTNLLVRTMPLTANPGR